MLLLVVYVVVVGGGGGVGVVVGCLNSGPYEARKAENGNKRNER